MWCRPLLAVLWVAMTGAVRAAPPQLTVCSDWGCATRQAVQLSHADWASVQGLFEPPPQTPADERRAIALAIARLERIAGESTGTSVDRGGNLQGPGQMDCVDESLNTQGYLRLLQEARLMRWHRPQGRALRSWFLLDQHWSAVIHERDSGERFSVDSWYGNNGQPPEIQPILDWYLKRHPPRALKQDDGQG
jgi:hypothetical protein